MKLYVGNLSYDSGESQLRELFGRFGEVSSITVITDRDTGRSKGFAFVEFSNDDEARAAIQAMDGKEFGGRNLKVNEARPREAGGPRGGGRDRGPRGGGRDRDRGGW
ncbi:RNA-binding protein [bacterium]|nr:RNA-binding protein [bacterium]